MLEDTASYHATRPSPSRWRSRQRKKAFHVVLKHDIGIYCGKLQLGSNARIIYIFPRTKKRSSRFAGSCFRGGIIEHGRNALHLFFLHPVMQFCVGDFENRHAQPGKGKSPRNAIIFIFVDRFCGTLIFVPSLKD